MIFAAASYRNCNTEKKISKKMAKETHLHLKVSFSVKKKTNVKDRFLAYLKAISMIMVSTYMHPIAAIIGIFCKATMVTIVWLLQLRHAH